MENETLNHDPVLRFVVFNLETGQITATFTAPRSMVQIQCRPGEGCLEDAEATDSTHYVLDGVITERPALDVPARISFRETSLTEHPIASGIPPGTDVHLNGDFLGTCDDGTLEYAPSERGLVTLRLVPPFPYREINLEVHVHEGALS